MAEEIRNEQPRCRVCPPVPAIQPVLPVLPDSFDLPVSGTVPVQSASEPSEGVQWLRSIAWLSVLGPFFFLSYGFANHLAERRAVTTSIVFGWEHAIPFVPWTIIPYWSIDLFYGLSFLFCRSRAEVDRHAWRLLTAQLISVACFIAFPLHFSFVRPAVDGLFGHLFELLMGFDQPYNQAPSLHISLLVILWQRCVANVRPFWRWPIHVMALLILISVLTTYQHHFFDIPTGLLVGFLCLWLWPDYGNSPLRADPLPINSRRRKIALIYAGSGLLCCVLAVALGGVALWLCWPACALLLVAAIYAWSGVSGFQKRDGRMSLAVRVLLTPYLLGAWLNSRLWTRHHPAPVEIADNVWLGRMPSSRQMVVYGFGGLCDLSGELSAPRGAWYYIGLPRLDLVAPNLAQLRQAAQCIEHLRQYGPVLVCCALGYSRSASAVLAWLLSSGRASHLAAAEAILRAQRPQVVVNPEVRSALAALADFPIGWLNTTPPAAELNAFEKEHT